MYKVDRRFWTFSSVKKVFKVQKDFPYDVKLRILAHSRSFLANQKARSAIVGAKNLLNVIIIWQGKSERSDWFFPGQDSAIQAQTVSVETVISCVFFCFRKPENSKQTWPECHVINYLLTQLARAVLRNIGPQSLLYGPRRARSLLPQPRANNPRYSPRARLVRGQYLGIMLVRLHMV